MTRPRSIALALLLMSCAGMRSAAPRDRAAEPHRRGHRHEDRGLDLARATRACPGPAGKVVVRVLDSPGLGQSDPVAFVREPEIHWIVALQIVETVEGDPIGERLGVLVHSPSMFASAVWGFGASPQEHPGTLELRWSTDDCLFELTGTSPPTVTRDANGGSFDLKAPTVHSMIVE